jgi:hypothetical protein
MNLKTRFAEGKTTHGIVLKRRSSHTGAREIDWSFHMLWHET